MKLIGLFSRQPVCAFVAGVDVQHCISLLQNLAKVNDIDSDIKAYLVQKHCACGPLTEMGQYGQSEKKDCPITPGSTLTHLRWHYYR